MRQFYLEYKDNLVLLSYALQIPWGQNLLILQKTINLEERTYYLKATDKMSWSRAVLLNQIKANAYQYQLKNPKSTNFIETLPEHLAEQANESLKSSYNLEFLGITKPVLERKMENMLVAKIRDFLIELGYGFTFIGNQYKIQLGDDEYFIDLLFYHRKLKCLVAIELKTVKFQPEFVSKMNFYLEILDETVKEPDENPSIGIILCAEKNNLTVEYALRTTNRPVGVVEYELTKDLKNKLPSPDEIKKQLIMIKENIANRVDG
jgi:predicted nuclease of restriction endonuclease-like (RecB) superfamily